jgi:hypothetical protein
MWRWMDGEEERSRSDGESCSRLVYGRHLSRAVKLGGRIRSCAADGRVCSRLEMSDSAATRRQLKIKAGVVKRFAVFHVLSITQEIPIRFLIPDNTQIPERTSALPRRGRGKPTETPIFHCHG